MLEELSQANDEIAMVMPQQDAVFSALSKSADELFKAYDDASSGIIAEQSMARRSLGVNFFQIKGIKKAVIAGECGYVCVSSFGAWSWLVAVWWSEG